LAVATVMVVIAREPKSVRCCGA